MKSYCGRRLYGLFFPLRGTGETTDLSDWRERGTFLHVKAWRKLRSARNTRSLSFPPARGCLWVEPGSIPKQNRTHAVPGTVGQKPSFVSRTHTFPSPLTALIMSPRREDLHDGSFSSRKDTSASYASPGKEKSNMKRTLSDTQK